MAIVGARPERGFRLEISRGEGDAPFSYEGWVRLPDGQDLPARVIVGREAEVEVTLEGGAAPLVDKVRALVRAVARQSISAGRPPPRRIHRWRDET